MAISQQNISRGLRRFCCSDCFKLGSCMLMLFLLCCVSQSCAQYTWSHHLWQNTLKRHQTKHLWAWLPPKHLTQRAPRRGDQKHHGPCLAVRMKQHDTWTCTLKKRVRVHEVKTNKKRRFRYLFDCRFWCTPWLEEQAEHPLQWNLLSPRGQGGLQFCFSTIVATESGAWQI